MPRYEVQTYTLCDGWVNCWTEDDKPQTFPTKKAAEKELNDFLREIREEIRSGEREADNGYDRGDFQIVPCLEPYQQAVLDSLPSDGKVIMSMAIGAGKAGS